MRACEGCGKADAPFYDYRQKCSCGRETKHDYRDHSPECFRIRHSVRPFLTHLRRIKKTDQFEDGHLIPRASDEYAYLRINGFKIANFNGFLYSTKVLCDACIQVWAERQDNKQAYEKAKKGKPGKSYYEFLCS